jgi:uncharacterized membrane protein YjjP (DUF1212 family)
MVAVDSTQPETSDAITPPLSIAERANLVGRVASVLQDNGESTDDTLAAAKRLSTALGLQVLVIPEWSGLRLQAHEADVTLSSIQATQPTNVNMNRVVPALRMVDQVLTGRLAPSAAADVMRAISGAAPAPTWLFTLAAVAGGAALSVLFGVEHFTTVVLIAISAALGAVLRRIVARYSTNALLQPFCAALVAGIIGALAVRLNLSSSLRLVALCPCLILVPGPHVLNAAMDVMSARISLGFSRLIYAAMVLLAISVGLLAGLAVLGASLPVDPPGREVAWWLDLLAAAVAVAAYSVYYSTPPRMWAWPIAIGTLAHGLRFVMIAMLGASVATGTFVACLLVGLALAPVARRSHMPFAAIGFASVVSMLPGSYLFRMASGLVQLGDSSAITLNLLSGTIADGVTAIAIIVGMSSGLIIPKLALTRFQRGSTT